MKRPSSRPACPYLCSWYLIILILWTCLCICSCSGDKSASVRADTGALAFSIRFSDQTQEAAAQSKAINFSCAGRHIATIEAYVYDERNNLLMQGGPWSCDQREGVIPGISPGTNRSLIITCRNASGAIVYQGQATGITVIGGSTTSTGAITVTSTNHAPVLAAITLDTVNAGTPISAALPEATDHDGDTLTYEAGNLPSSSATFNPATRVFSWPDPTAGEHQIRFIVHDNGTPRRSDYRDVTLRVISFVAGNPRHPVLAAIGPQTVGLGETLGIQLSATDPDHGTITFSATSVSGKTALPTAYDFNTATGAFSWDTASVNPGNYSILFTVSNTNALTDSEEVTITVGNANRPPALTPIGTRWASDGQAMTIVLTATDPEDDDLAYSIEASGLTDVVPIYTEVVLDTASQTVTWTPVGRGSNTYAFRVVVTDSQGNSDFEDVRVRIP